MNYVLFMHNEKKHQTWIYLVADFFLICSIKYFPKISKGTKTPHLVEKMYSSF